MRLEIQPPPGFAPDSIALSQDGRQIAFVAPVEGVRKIWVRRLDQESAQPLHGTDDASFPFWSPDGRALGFFAGGKLQRIDLAGGSPQVLADVAVGRGGAWNGQGIILFAPTLNGGLMRVAATGGRAEEATKLRAEDRGHRWPHFLPDGRRFLFGSLGEGESRGLFLGSLDGDPPVRLMDAGAAAWYSSGHLVVGMGSSLSAVPFDPERGRMTGDPVPIVQDLFRYPAGRASASLSATGLCAYVRGTFGHRRLVWLDRAGAIVGTVGPPDPAGLANPELSPDGRRVAVTRITDGLAVWLIDIARGVPTRLTLEAGTDTAPFWSPDGERILYRHQVGSASRMFVTTANALGQARVLEGRISATPSGWSPDGRLVLYVLPGDDLMAIDLERQQSFPVAQTQANEGWGEFSPDGRFVAYQSNESGRFEIYVRTFPGPKASGWCRSPAARSRGGVATEESSITWRRTTA